MTPAGQNLTVKVGNEERESAYSRWRFRQQLWVGHRDADEYTHGAFIDMPFVRSVEEIAYEVNLNEVISWLREEGSVPTGSSLSL